MSKPVCFHPPTLIVASVIYGGWLLATYHHDAVPAIILAALGAILITWQGSLQHEGVHRLICKPGWLNDMIAGIPLILWLPFQSYRQSHLAHHDFTILTDPRRDPESYYVNPAEWSGMPWWHKRVLTFHNTLPGRLLIGPFLMIGQFLRAEARVFVQGGNRRIWLIHGLLCLLPVGWLVLVAKMDLGLYLVTFVLPGSSLMLVRSFAEHKAKETPFERTALIESSIFFSLLFLNNNLHFAHHKKPHLNWTALGQYYRQECAALRRENGGLFYQNYREVARRFWRHPVDAPAHPFIE